MKGTETMRRKSRAFGTDNVLRDLGFADAGELSAKTILAMKLNAILAERGLIQMKETEVLCMPQAKVSAIRIYKVSGISLERLMQALVVLGQNISIVVRPKAGQTVARIDVAA